MPLPDLESLACVDALARTLRFHVAAKSCALSPAAFSKRVQQVEAHVGAPLFLRTTRAVALTDLGMALLPRIRRMLDEARALADVDVDAGAGATPIELVLGTRHELGMSWVLPARADLQTALPQLTTHLRFGDGGALEEAVLRLRLDAVITSHAPSTRALEAIPLHKEDYVVVAAPRLLRRLPLRDADDAGAHTLIDADESLPLFAYLRTTGLPVRFARVVTLGTIAAINSAVVAGEGVAVLPKYFVAEGLRRRQLVTVLPKARLGHDWFRLVFRADDARRPLFEQVARVLKARPLS